MNSRERVIRALEFNKPDRIPNGCYFLPSALAKYGDKLLKLFKEYPRDFSDLGPAYMYTPTLKTPELYLVGRHKDEWGVVWETRIPGLLGQPVCHPLENAELEEIKQYPVPDVDAIFDFESIKRYVRHCSHKYSIGYGGCIFERIHYLRGFEQTLKDIVFDRKELTLLIEKVFEFNMEVIKRWLDVDVDGLYFWDDWGTQKTLMINPTKWRKYFKPYYRRMFDICKKAGKHIFFHSDGNILEIIPDLVEIGVNAINLQERLIGVDTLSERFGGRVCFLIDFDRQNLLSFGTPDELRDYLRYITETLGKFDGGIIAVSYTHLTLPTN